MKVALFHLAILLLAMSLAVKAVELPRPNQFGGDFALSSTLGKTLSVSEFKGKLVVLNFGFTSCPDVCPMILSKLALVQKQLDEDGIPLQVLFVTVDPERDTLDKMKTYLAHYHQGFIGLRSEDEAKVSAILKQYGGVLDTHIEASGRRDISHSDYVYVLDREGYVAGFYDIKSHYKDLLAAIRKLAKS